MTTVSTADVLLYYPNLIGYGRFIFMLLSFALAQSSWKAAVVCYILAFVGDVVDGYVARAFNQCK
jgi:CDP-diacylglycerol--inositol 3-phosphatidyltransferase